MLDATWSRSTTFEAGIRFITDTRVWKMMVNLVDWDRIRYKGRMVNRKQDSLLGEKDAKRLGFVILDPDRPRKEVLQARRVQNSRRQL